ncbi:MAG: DNA-3-methyladenine glycosylase I [Candidatus Eisenbacteria bacterium]|uniref:DNA-3-methyladenine glycosylase I n=1 Tax=Eiseniibacteriota bacterium TaxID=2212470 RepID=A0A7Y2EBR7_UNCEI|nr:DNA-3-methyladenine glycosylase I [Candidatus Eisenbacteria bacterium]
MKRCGWVGKEPIYHEYHDTEWGVPEWEDDALFEKLILDGFQAGLSWITILKKRDNFRKAFSSFDAKKIARYREARVEKLMQDTGIVRNRQKIVSTVGNAKAYLAIQKEGSFSDYLWEFVGGKPVQNRFKAMSDLPSKTETSIAMSKDLQKRGFRFVGPTICYAFMQAVGMVNDHTTDCFRHKEVKRL